MRAISRGWRQAVVIPQAMLRLLLIAALASSACAGGSDGGGGGAPPAKPGTGAPLAFEVTKVTPDEEEGILHVKAYNFSDKPIAGYGIVMRYLDAAGAPIKVKVGTPFEADFDFWSMSGRSYLCKPKGWCSFEIDGLDIPKGTVKAKVLATSVRAVKPDGINFEEGDLWHLPGRGSQWPDENAAPAPAAPAAEEH